ncbi:MAG: hypothetical protein Aurels2KO_18130 [Aureliella sp.]
MLAKLKLASLVALGLFALVVVFQNLNEVEVHLLFATLTMRQATLIAGTLLVGFLMGLTASALWKVRSWRAKAKAKSKAATPAPEVTTDT